MMCQGVLRGATANGSPAHSSTIMAMAQPVAPQIEAHIPQLPAEGTVGGGEVHVARAGGVCAAGAGGPTAGQPTAVVGSDSQWEEPTAANAFSHWPMFPKPQAFLPVLSF